MGLLLLSILIPRLLIHDDDAVQVGVVGAEAAQVGEIALAQQSAFDLELELVPLVDRSAAEAALGSEEVDAVLIDATTALTDATSPRPLRPCWPARPTPEASTKRPAPLASTPKAWAGLSPSSR